MCAGAFYRAGAFLVRAKPTRPNRKRKKANTMHPFTSVLNLHFIARACNRAAALHGSRFAPMCSASFPVTAVKEQSNNAIRKVPFESPVTFDFEEWGLGSA
jgi:hypothetical protein